MFKKKTVFHKNGRLDPLFLNFFGCHWIHPLHHTFSCKGLQHKYVGHLGSLTSALLVLLLVNLSCQFKIEYLGSICPVCVKWFNFLQFFVCSSDPVAISCAQIALSKYTPRKLPCPLQKDHPKRKFPLPTTDLKGRKC